MSLEKWQALLSTLEVSHNPMYRIFNIEKEYNEIKDYHKNISSMEDVEEIANLESVYTCTDIERFEELYKIKLPSEFKLFSQVFGEGRFGCLAEIFCFDKSFSEGEKKLLTCSISFVEKAIESKYLLTWGSIEQAEKLVKYGFTFAKGFSGESFVWDLSSYNEEGDNYDIYFISHNDIWSCNLGRSFYDFVVNFCLGNQFFEVLPPHHHPEPEWIFPVFERILFIRE